MREFDELKAYSIVDFKYEPIFPKIGHYAHRFTMVRKFNLHQKLSGPKSHMAEVSKDDIKIAIEEIESTHCKSFTGGVFIQIETNDGKINTSGHVRTENVKDQLFDIVKILKNKNDMRKIVSLRVMLVW